MFAIRDAESQTHSQQPFAFPTVRDAKEALRDLASDEKTSIGRHPHDFRLVCIGDYDPREGVLIPAHQAENICWANELLTNGEEA